MSALRLARRFLLKDRAFSFLAILVLTLGIGGVATMFSVINGMMLRLPAFPHAEQLVSVSFFDTVRNRSTGGAAAADYLEWTAGQQSFEQLALFGARLSVNITYRDVPRRYGGVYVTHNFFRTLGVQPMLGRDFTAEDDRPGAPKTIIISHRAWQDEFGAAPSIIGEHVQINGRVGTIIGVMPPDFAFPFSDQVWTPVFAEFTELRRNDPQGFGGNVLGRLRPGVSIDQAAAELGTQARRIAADFPETNRALTAVEIVPIMETYLGPQLRQLLLIMLGAVVVVLLIACVNVMNMQFARATRRARDLAICSALGASRWQLLRQMLVESLTLATCGALGGTLLALWTTELMLRYARSLTTPPPAWVTFNVDGRVLAAIVLVTFATALFSGLVPAWLASRSSPITLLREGGRGSTNRRTHRIVRGLVILQITLTTALLVVCTFMIRSMINQQRINWGYDTRTVLGARMTLFQADYPSPAALSRHYGRVLDELRSDPHFAHVALSTRFRLAISNRGPFELEGSDYGDNRPRPTAAVENVTDGYFDTLGLKLVAGRDFARSDDLDAPPVVLVNTEFARRYFASESPLGRRLRIAPPNSPPGPWLTIVGVAPDTRTQGPTDGIADGCGIFQPLYQSPQRWITIAVRGHGGSPVTLVEPLRQAMARVDRNQPIYGINTIDRLIAVTYAQNRRLASLFSTFGVVAMVLAAVGLYGVMSFAVGQRTNEYGVRMALGADTGAILRMILREGAIQLAYGLVFGVLLAVALVTVGSAFMQNFLFQVGRADPLVWGSTVALLSSAALVACLAPALRATRVDPVVALRAE